MLDKELFPKELWPTLEGEEGEKVRKSINGAMQKKAAMMGIKVDKTKALEEILATIGDDVEEDLENEDPNEEGGISCLYILLVPITNNGEQTLTTISKIKTRIWAAITMPNNTSTMVMMVMMATKVEEGGMTIRMSPILPQLYNETPNFVAFGMVLNGSIYQVLWSWTYHPFIEKLIHKKAMGSVLHE
jgi:hypothetical protein